MLGESRNMLLSVIGFILKRITLNVVDSNPRRNWTR